MKSPHKWNSTIRVRLTALYAGTFFVAGAILIGVMYLQLRQVIGQQLVVRSVIVGGRSVAEPPGPPTTFKLPLPEKDGTSAPRPDADAQLPPLPATLTEAQAQLGKARAEVLRSLLFVLVTSLLAAGVIAALLGWLLAGQALQPLRQITATLRGIADRNLHQRIAMNGPRDEIKDLADTLDGMLERLDRAFDSQQRFIANASHELRTPLAINRTLIEVAMLKEARPDSFLSQTGATLLAVNQRHEQLIDGLLMLASSEHAIADPRDADLAQIARHVLPEIAATAEAADVEVRAQLEPANCRGDPLLLERLIHNLVDNALRYNVASGGWIRITTGTDPQGRACLDVENTGPVIAPYEVPRLFEPFRRLSSTERLAESPGRLGRRGAGLGLSIVRAIVISHRGEVRAEARPEGGLAVHVALPAQA